MTVFARLTHAAPPSLATADQRAVVPKVRPEVRDPPSPPLCACACARACVCHSRPAEYRCAEIPNFSPSTMGAHDASTFTRPDGGRYAAPCLIATTASSCSGMMCFWTKICGPG